MAEAEEYLKLVENAYDALHALLTNTEPGTGLALHVAYNQLRERLEGEHDDEPEKPKTPETDRQQIDDYRPHLVWGQTPRDERKHMILNALGDHRLLVREIVEQIRSTDEKYRAVHYDNVSSVLTDLLNAGEVTRTKELRAKGGTATRWRYQRRVELTPEITALQRALDETRGA